MKKLLALILCVSMLLPIGIGLGVSAEGTQPTCDAYLTDAVIQVDGVKESAWENAPSFKLENIRKTYLSDGDLIENGSPAEVTVSLLWDDTRIASANKSLYVFVEVKDSTPYTVHASAWENDSFEMWIRVKGQTKKLMIKRDGTTPAAPAWPWKEAAAKNSETCWTAEYRVELNCPQDSDSSNTSRPDWTGSTMYVDFAYNDATAANGGRVACIGWCDNQITTAANATTDQMGICKLNTTVAKGVIPYANDLPALESMTTDTFADATAYMVVAYSGGVVARITYKPLWDGTSLYVLAEVVSDNSPYWNASAAYSRDAFWINLTVNGGEAKLRMDRGGAMSGWGPNTDKSAKWPWAGNHLLRTGDDGFANVYKIDLSYKQVANDNSTKPSVTGSIKMGFKYLNATNDTGSCSTVSSKGTEYELAQPASSQPSDPAKAAVDFVGYQLTPAADRTEDGVDNKTFDLRLVAVLKNADYEKYEHLGFEVTVAVDGKTVSNKQDITTVYESVIGTEGSGYTEYTAEQLGGAYIFALNCNNIPVAGDVTFTVTPYSLENGATAEVFGDSATFTVSIADFN